LVVNVLGLQDTVGVTILQDDPIKASRGGWIFTNKADSKFNVGDLRELYEELSPNHQGRCTAPLLVDLKAKQIVSNESSDIVRMLPLLLSQTSNKEAEAASSIDLCSPHLTTQIDTCNEWIYQLLNNGVYRCGFSTTQLAYDRASADVRKGLAKCQSILEQQPYINGDTFTESDIFLLPTMLRFDGVYAPLFKAGGSHLRLQCDYPAVHAWMKRCWNEVDGVKGSIDLADASSSYYKQLFPLNPGGIIPSTVTARGLGLEQ
jgi:putative glutathione S-transferase